MNQESNRKTLNIKTFWLNLHLLFMPLLTQTAWLFLLALPVACISWTVTHEEVFREPRDYCAKCAQKAKTIAGRKFFYLFTCEYCFSHYITVIMLFVTRFQLLFTDWRGYLIAGFALVFVANVYMSVFALIRTDLKKVRIEAENAEEKRDAG